MNLEIVRLSALSQTEKEKYHVTLICGIQKEMIQMSFTKQRLTQLENELIARVGEGWGKGQLRSLG